MTADYMSSGRVTVVVVLLCIWGVIVFVAIMRADRVHPNPSDGTTGKNALEQIANEGVDFVPPTEMAFVIEAHEEASAVAIEKALINHRYNACIHFFCAGEVEGAGTIPSNAVRDPVWMIYSNLSMTPKHEKIIKIKADLVRIVKPYGGKYKGLKHTPTR